MPITEMNSSSNEVTSVLFRGLMMCMPFSACSSGSHVRFHAARCSLYWRTLSSRVRPTSGSEAVRDGFGEGFG
eukprot:CAMPEP_0195128242 /NCGR_PEP_ID=MMETSP0448-20130528/138752_1 /TAXON_ID=66468 /ORGANISM="Heterocapsa triquestra, Strain CCMP 448" /LENGTH=72 /DNA_ID=CAMNT_0040166029 /DNA_START=60 /DNA_END=274 /DNA_ORIENTATION=-